MTSVPQMEAASGWPRPFVGSAVSSAAAASGGAAGDNSATSFVDNAGGMSEPLAKASSSCAAAEAGVTPPNADRDLDSVQVQTQAVNGTSRKPLSSAAPWKGAVQSNQTGRVAAPSDSSISQGHRGVVTPAKAFSYSPEESKILCESIDSALMSALRDPRERLGLLKLEKIMVDFVNMPSEHFIEVGGPCNSHVFYPAAGVFLGGNTAPNRSQTTFQRCILHRLADRFSITRENGTLMESCIRLIKSSESRIPQHLLIHLDSTAYCISPAEISKPFELMKMKDPSNSSRRSLTSKPKQQKMKIMKRNSSVDSSSSSKSDRKLGSRSASRRGKAFSDKEKAYAEARARIFNNGDAPEAQMPNDDGSSQSNLTQSVSQNAAICSPTVDRPEVVQSTISDASQSSTFRKATIRNRQQEENDPDFKRGHNLAHPVYTRDSFPPHQNMPSAMQQQTNYPHHYAGYSTSSDVFATQVPQTYPPFVPGLHQQIPVQERNYQNNQVHNTATFIPHGVQNQEPKSAGTSNDNQLFIHAPDDFPSLG